MNNSFSLRRMGLLTRRHYAENRKSYFIVAAISVVLVVCSFFWTKYMQDAILIQSLSLLTVVVFPIIFTLISLRSYYNRQTQIEACMLPATCFEKFLFATLNIIVLSFAACAVMEVAGSILKEQYADSAQIMMIPPWFVGWNLIWSVILNISSTGLFACLLTRRPAVGYLIVGAGYLIVSALPMLFAIWCLGVDGGEIKVPYMFSEFISSVSAGDVSMEYSISILDGPVWLSNLIFAAIMLPAAYFRFREKQLR